ncbi:hypothetical protein HMPREF3213_03460 [Heyndrickxia coagulans]|uniref:Uncharacterized protein n=1 Tax=Heyndrickxia coagulans TaxID=1398 RepID=A0A133KBX8_HEYCO|nr:hypothetical protein HMPREF3213_03460 [Heyndrickxia coagulans]
MCNKRIRLSPAFAFNTRENRDGWGMMIWGVLLLNQIETDKLSTFPPCL